MEYNFRETLPRGTIIRFHIANKHKTNLRDADACKSDDFTMVLQCETNKTIRIMDEVFDRFRFLAEPVV